nr:hypothetical protein [Micromonospora sp. DSM 115978]
MTDAQRPDPAASAARLAEITGCERHDVAVVLGSGWRPAADVLAARGRLVAEVSFAELGGFPTAAVPGHTGAAHSVDLDARRLLLYLGRVPAYDGHDLAQVVHHVRTAVAAGAATLELPNAAGGLREDRDGGP